MRSITNYVVREGFQIGVSRKRGNTESKGDSLYLFGNRIAYRKNGLLYISLCGWDTVTTRDRLNAICGISVSRSKDVTLLNGKPWDGNEIALIKRYWDKYRAV